MVDTTDRAGAQTHEHAPQQWFQPSRDPEPSQGSALSRRGLFGGALAGLGLAGAGFAAGRFSAPAAATPMGQDRIHPLGPVQAGIITPPTAHSRLLAFELRSEVDGAALERLLRILTADIEALSRGEGPLADTEPELAELPARLTTTVGFGPELVRRISPAAVPEWLAPLPAFSRDRLDPAYSGGDLLLMISSDDPTTVAHAARMLMKSVRAFATPRWRQDGFRRARGAEPEDRTMRNLMGQVEGTVNPHPEEQEDFASIAWVDEGPDWLHGGTAMVVRRIRMEMDTWDQVDRVGREETIGRDLAVGAPLTGTDEFDEPDFGAKDSLGFHVIADTAHIRRAHSTDPAERIYRRAINYDEGDEQGLLFICFQRNPLTQFVPIQRRLDDVDMLNEWVTHVGSAVFAIAPGWDEGGMLGETLLASAG